MRKGFGAPSFRLGGHANSLLGKTLLPALLAAFAIAQSPSPATALTIDATFDSSITSASNAAAIENAINTSIATMDGLYINPTVVNVYFELGNSGHFLAETFNGFHADSYSTYVSALQADAAAHPNNTVLATAIANLSHGNDSNGARQMAATTGLLRTLGLPNAPCYTASLAFNCFTGIYDAYVVLSATSPIGYTRPIPAYNGSNLEYDGIGLIEHELDEVLGGGGAGSALTYTGNSFFTNKYLPLDPYRYSAPDTPSFTTSGSATSYFSIDGGVTEIVGFNQNSNGDYSDFGPSVDACSAGGHGGPAGLIQDAFNCNNEQRENYTTSSPEFTMLEAIGWDPVPEAPTLLVFGTSVLGLAALRRRAGRV